MRTNKEDQNFTYSRSWEQIENMLVKAEQKQVWHFSQMQSSKKKSDKIKHMRNYKALEGVVTALRWVLGDRNIVHPLE